MLKLVIRKGPKGKGTKYILNSGERKVIGRTSDADICLASKGVSKSHCQLTVLGGSRIEVEDLGSSNGTFINGAKIKKMQMRPGDLLSIHEFVLSLSLAAPELSFTGPSATASGGVRIANGHLALDSEGLQIAMDAEAQRAPSYANPNYQQMDFASSSPAAYGQPSFEGENVDAAPEEPRTLGEKANAWLENSLYPWADGLQEKFDIRLLLGASLGLWAVLLVAFTVSPFYEKANSKVEKQALETAKLYARQLVRVNQQAIIDQRFRDLVGTLDQRAGQTPGIKSSAVIDVARAQIIAPPELLGQGVQSAYASRALTFLTERSSESGANFAEVDSNGVGHVAAPVMIGTSEGNKTVAIAYVTYNVGAAQFTPIAMIDQAVGSLLYTLIASLLLILMAMRWINGPLTRASALIDVAMKKSSPTIESPANWPALSQLLEQVSSALGRSSANQGMASANVSGGGAWADASVGASGTAAAGFNESLIVTSWNPQMERIIGIRASTAIGGGVNEASRDVAFETAIRELSALALGAPWAPQKRKIEFSGTAYSMFMTYGEGGYLITLFPEEA